MIPSGSCLRLVRRTAQLWLCAIVAGTTAVWLVGFTRSFWSAAIYLTLVSVKPVLRLFLSDVICDPVTGTVGTARFSAVMEAPCSGVEGVGLMLVFSTAWLWAFRKECRFPKALLLIPAGVATIWLTNLLRIVVLIGIGNAGMPEIALGGFHSQAGWIAFNSVALGFCLVAQHSSWFSVSRPAPKTKARSEDSTAAYLMPLLSILTAGMIAHAVSASFEWLYPLRFLAAVAVIWCYRRAYARLDWKFGLHSLGIGGFVYILWMAFDRMAAPVPDNAMPAALSAVPEASRIGWVAVRAVAAIVTVPIAEELAFRAFLIRRAMVKDFESLSPRTFTWFGLLLSSVVFGMLHGSRWFPGILAGLCYAYALLRRGRIGDAVAAHATTNALIAISVLLQGRWNLW
jgi:exosortase E/protease (VPEID-CTERM system)